MLKPDREAWRQAVMKVQRAGKSLAAFAAALAELAKLNFPEIKVRSIPEQDLNALTHSVVKATGNREFLKDSNRRYVIYREGNRKEHRTKVKAQRQRRRQNR